MNLFDKRTLHRIVTIIRGVKLWQLAALLVVMLLTSAYLLRQNSLHMISLRDQVNQADKQNKDVAQALTTLRNYVTAHMNTSMGDTGLYLEASYQRAYDRAVQVAAQSGAHGSEIYLQADKSCQGLFSRTASFPAYVQCVIDKVAASGSAQDPVAAIKAPLPDLYRYNFVSPIWSPDLAGFAVLITWLVGLLVLGAIGLRVMVYILIGRSVKVS